MWPTVRTSPRTPDLSFIYGLLVLPLFDRKGEQGLTNPILKIINYFLSGTTVTADDEGNETILANTAVKLFDKEECSFNTWFFSF